MDQNSAVPAALAGAIRHVLTAAGGALAADGYVTTDQVNLYVGIIMAVLGVAWSVWQKYKSKAATAAAVTDAVKNSSGTVSIRGALGLAAVGLAILLVGCTAAPVGTTQNTAYSPREQAQSLQDSYAIVLAAAETAIDTGKLPASAVKQIGAASQAATAAEKAAVAESMKCWRDKASGVVGDAPNLPDGQHCDTALSGRLISAFSNSLGQLQGAMAAFGVKLPAAPAGG
jgi:hypothetical protein